MEIIPIAIARKANVRLLLVLVSVSICSLVALIVYQISHSSTYVRRMPSYGGKYDLHNDQFDDKLIADDKFLNHVETIEDPIVVVGSPLRYSNLNSSAVRLRSVAIGCAITSHNEEHLSVENVAYKLPFLRTLVPSFCKTVTLGYDYHFYAAFDSGDPHLGKENFMEAIYDRFNEIIGLLCPKKIKALLHFVQCNHNHNPTWAQNDAMIEAYLDGVEYYYRVNDDTLMLTPGWTESYIEGLLGFSPPNIGVVGPLHKGGNEDILTYDFVHRTHIDIFGYYYPRIFTDWWADNWITQVYGERRTLKLPNVRLIHTGEAGTRYEVKTGKQRFLEVQIKDDQQTLERFLAAVEESRSAKASATKKVVSMSLWGSQTRYTFGALRNAQLMPVHFPGWTLRIYVEKPRDDDTTVFPPVPKRILAKLVDLGAEVMRVDAGRSHIPPMMWRFLVADDMSVDYFIVRDSDCRVQDRDYTVVVEWIASKTAFHCIRDHPSHAQYPVLGGLWGGIPRKLHEILPIPWQDLMMGLRSDYSQDMSFLASAVWPKVQSFAFCHDSVSCKSWLNSHPFPVARLGTEHLGQVFDAFGNARDEDIQILLENRPADECTVVRHDHPPGDAVTAAILSLSSSKAADHLNDIGRLQLLNATKTNISGFLLQADASKEGFQEQHIPVKKLLKTSDYRNTSFQQNRSSIASAIANINASLTVSPDILDPKFRRSTVKKRKRDSLLTFSSRQNASSSASTALGKVKGRHGDPVVNPIQRPIEDSSSRKALPSVVVWTMNYDIFPLRSVKDLLSSDRFRFIDQSLASNCRETRTCARNLRIITRKTGLDLTEDLIHAFHEEYESDPEMNLVSHFLCTYPISLCELYTDFNRPIVLYISSRYEHGRYTAAKWRHLNTWLATIATKASSRILAASAYDAHYLKYFTGIEATVIAPHCGYSGVTYRPKSAIVLLSATGIPAFDEDFVRSFDRAVKGFSVDLRIVSSADISSVAGRVSSAAVALHLAVVHIPLDAVTEDLCDHLAIGIPIFVPTLDLAVSWHFQYDVLSRFTWNSVRHLQGEKSGGSPLPPALGMEDIPDPNANQNRTAVKYWLKLSAFYQSPFVVYFSSFEDLITKLQHTNLTETSAAMVQRNTETRLNAAEQWLKIFNRN